MEEPNYSSSNETPSSQGKQPASSEQEQKVEELVNQALERKQTIQSLNQLRTRLGWLTGLFVIAIIVLGGGLGWVSYRLQQQQKQLVQQNDNPENLERIQQLEGQIEELQQQVPNPKTIKRLDNQLDEVTTAVDNNQQTLERLLKRLQDQQSQEGSPEFNFSDSFSPSNESPSNETETSN